MNGLMLPTWLWLSVLVLVSWGTLGLFQKLAMNYISASAALVWAAAGFILLQPLLFPGALDFRVFHQKSGLGAAEWRIQWPGLLELTGGNASRWQGLDRRTPDCLVSCLRRPARPCPAAREFKTASRAWNSVCSNRWYAPVCGNSSGEVSGRLASYRSHACLYSVNAFQGLVCNDC